MLERRAGWLAAIGTLGLLASTPVWIAPGPDGPVAGACGTIELLLLALAPLSGMALCMLALSAEWGPALPAPPPPGHHDAARASAARRIAAGLLDELVVRRRRDLVGLMGWLLIAELIVVLAVTIARIGSL